MIRAFLTSRSRPIVSAGNEFGPPARGRACGVRGDAQDRSHQLHRRHQRDGPAHQPAHCPEHHPSDAADVPGRAGPPLRPPAQHHLGHRRGTHRRGVGHRGRDRRVRPGTPGRASCTSMSSAPASSRPTSGPRRRGSGSPGSTRGSSCMTAWPTPGTPAEFLRQLAQTVDAFRSAHRQITCEGMGVSVAGRVEQLGPPRVRAEPPLGAGRSQGHDRGAPWGSRSRSRTRRARARWRNCGSGTTRTT